MLKMEVVILVLFGLLIVWFAIVRWLLFDTKRQLREERKKCNLQLTESAYLRQLLIKELLLSIEDMNSLLLSRHDKSKVRVHEYRIKLTDKCRRLFTTQFNYLHSKYALLDTRDIVLILLLGLEVDNQTIANILDCSLRTIYKRRQRVAREMQISSLDLDKQARQVINLSIENTIGMP